PSLFYHCQGFFHSSVMDQPSRKTRTTESYKPPPVTSGRGSGDLQTTTSFGGCRALRTDGSCMKKLSHGCILSTTGPSHRPGALSPLSLVFILG
uniref:Uncharacterized protein n=1 Tax=Rhinolophus ferrumequinum TaxID=59479 RepID=A0A671ECI2_RHIFE